MVAGGSIQSSTIHLTKPEPIIWVDNLISVGENVMRTMTSMAIIMFLAVGSAQSQEAVDLFFLNQINNPTSQTIMNYNANAGYFEGHPFYHDEWTVGSITTTTGNVLENIELRFEAYTGSLVVKRNDRVGYANPNAVRSFMYTHDSGHYHFKNGFTIPSERITPETFVQMIHEGEKWTVIKLVRKVFKEADFDPTFQRGSRYDRFEESSRYLARKNDGQWEVFLPRRRTLERMLDIASRDLREFVRINDLDYGNDSDLGRIFAADETGS